MENFSVSSGIDWLTASSGNLAVCQKAYDLWEKMKADRLEPATPPEKSNWYGYKGEKVPGAFYGERADGACMRVSGDVAAFYGPTMLVAGLRPSRLDLQITHWSYIRPTQLLKDHFRQVATLADSGHLHRKVRFWRDLTGPTGMAVGSRQSRKYLRIYDKGKESRQPDYDGAIRYEVELKEEAAVAAAWIIVRELDMAAAIRRLVVGHFEECGILLELPEKVDGLQVKIPVQRPDTAAAMAWLTTQVAPTIRKLLPSVGRQKLLWALFGDTLEEKE
jgi:hypothetical protein